MLRPFARHSSIHNSVIAAEGYIHELVNCVIFRINWYYLLRSRAHSQNASCRRINDRWELVHTKHTQVGDSEGASGQFVRLQLIVSGSYCNVLHLRRDLLEAFWVGVLQDWWHQSSISLDSNRHMHFVELADEIVHVRGVDLRNGNTCQGSSFDDEVIDGDFRGWLVVKVLSDFQQVVHLHSRCHLEVRNVLLRKLQAICDHFSNLGHFHILVSKLGPCDELCGSVCRWLSLGLGCQNIVLQNAAVGSTSLQCFVVNTSFEGSLPGQGADENPARKVGTALGDTVEGPLIMLGTQNTGQVAAACWFEEMRPIGAFETALEGSDRNIGDLLGLELFEHIPLELDLRRLEEPYLHFYCIY